MRTKRRRGVGPEDPFGYFVLGKALYAMAAELSLDPKIHAQAPSVKRKDNGGA